MANPWPPPRPARKTRRGVPGTVRSLRRSEVERNEISVLLDQQHRLRFPGFGIASHARRISGHTRQRQTDCIWTLNEQFDNRASWNVTLDHIAINQRGVARTRTQRNPMLPLELGQLGVLGEIDLGSKILQVPDPP